VTEWLENLVILIDPVLNPDGLDRFAQWVNSNRGVHHFSADPFHREHRETWPGSRTNYYWFDLNRDWMPLVHPESQGRIEQFHQWRPQILGDFHEMGTDRTYFFQPGVPSRNNPLTPERNYELTAEIARFNAAALDQVGSLYYTRETFDDFYVGKGSTYPDLNGAIGILFEQASSRGHVQESIYGPVTFPFTIRNQVIASFGTLRGANALRDELLQYPAWFRDRAADWAAAEEVQGYIFRRPADRVREYEFLQLLDRHQIRVHELERTVTLDGEDFRAGEALLVPLAQPQAVLVKSLFARQTEFAESVFYDISTWVLPSSYNIAAYPVTAEILGNGTAGSRVVVERPAGRLIGGRSDYAYGFSWDSFDAARAVQSLMRAGILVTSAGRPFVMPTEEGNIRFGAGSIIVPVGVQQERADEIHRLIRNLAGEVAVDFHAFHTGLVYEGIDLGSPSAEVLEMPAVAVVVGDGVDRAAAGEIWHLFDHRAGAAVSLIDASLLNRINLQRYNVIILPSGSYGAVTEAGVASMRRWMQQGGTLIALQGAARWAINQKLASGELAETAGRGGAPERLPYGEGADRERLRNISGAIVVAHVDPTHPLGFGLGDERMRLFRQGTLFLKLASNPYETPVAYEADPLYSGYISEQNRQTMGNTAAVTVSPLGSGRAILFADNPTFRGYWLGSTRLLLNAIYQRQHIRRISVPDDGEHGHEH
jgi:hypothetical protein